MAFAALLKVKRFYMPLNIALLIRVRSTAVHVRTDLMATKKRGVRGQSSVYQLDFVRTFVTPMPHVRVEEMGPFAKYILLSRSQQHNLKKMF